MEKANSSFARYCHETHKYFRFFQSRSNRVNQKITWALELNDKCGVMNKTCKSLSSSSISSTLATYNFWSFSYTHTI